MKRGSGRRRLGAGLLAFLTAWTCVLPAAAEEEEKKTGDGVAPVYDEAYYATLDYYGNLMEGSVVKSYALNGFDALTDRGRYDEVVNLTDGTDPLIEEGSLSFQFGEKAPERFYFEGKTAQPFAELPWSVAVRYTLNGVPARAEDLAGQRGVVEILLDLVPNPQAGEYARYNYTLEAAALFNQDDILSLEAPGAQVQLVGNLRTVLFLALPGEEQHFTIRVGSDSFTFGGLTVLMVPATLAQLEEVSRLSQRKEDLEADYHALSGSLDTLLDALSQMEGGLYDTADGLDQLEQARQTVSGGKGAVYDGTDALLEDLGGLSELLEPVESRVQKLRETVTDSTALLNRLSDEALKLQKELEDLEEALSDLEDGTGDLERVLRCTGDLEDSLRRLQSALDITLPGEEDPEGSTVSAAGAVAKVKQVHQAYDAVQNGTRAEAFEALLLLQGTDPAEAKKQAEAADLLADLPDVETAAQAVRMQARQQVLAAAGLTEESFRQLPAEQQAAVQAQIDQAQAAAEAQVRAQFPAVRQLKGLYIQGKGASFQDFCASLPGVSQSQAKQMNDLWTIYSSGSAGAALVDLVSGGLDAANQELNRLEKELKAELERVAGPSAELMGELADLCGRLGGLTSLLDDAEDLTAALRGSSREIRAVMDKADELRDLLNGYEPTLQSALANSGSLSEAGVTTLQDTRELIATVEELARSSGGQLDEGTRKSLQGLSDSLRRSAEAMAATGDVQAAKGTLTDIIEDTWREYTGDLNTMLLMDAEADPVSLTDPENPAPASVQVLLRTREIQVEEPETDTPEEAETDNSTFWGRVARMFRDFWNALTGIFQGKGN